MMALTISSPMSSQFDGRQEEAKANAAFIVKAVNCHDHLVTALVEILANAEDGSWTLPSSFAARARKALATAGRGSE
jgi:hypothetical protein